MIVLSAKARSLLSWLLFLVAWLLGNIGLMVSFERGANLPGACVFAIACVLWWTSYKMSLAANGRASTLGFVALTVWTLNLVGALVFDFHDCVHDPFFWVSTAMFLLLITGLVFSEASSGASKMTPTA